VREQSVSWLVCCLRDIAGDLLCLFYGTRESERERKESRTMIDADDKNNTNEKDQTEKLTNLDRSAGDTQQVHNHETTWRREEEEGGSE